MVEFDYNILYLTSILTKNQPTPWTGHDSWFWWFQIMVIQILTHTNKTKNSFNFLAICINASSEKPIKKCNAKKNDDTWTTTWYICRYKLINFRFKKQKYKQFI